jgi:hypothetical protein
MFTRKMYYFLLTILATNMLAIDVVNKSGYYLRVSDRPIRDIKTVHPSGFFDLIKPAPISTRKHTRPPFSKRVSPTYRSIGEDKVAFNLYFVLYNFDSKGNAQYVGSKDVEFSGSQSDVRVLQKINFDYTNVLGIAKWASFDFEPSGLKIKTTELVKNPEDIAQPFETSKY